MINRDHIFQKQSLPTLNRRNFVATCAVTKLHKATTSWSNWHCTANHMHCIVVICYEPVSRDKWIISSHKLVHLTKNLILIRDRNWMFSPQLRKGSRSQSFLEPICELDILIIPHKQILCNLDIWIYLVTIAVLPNLYVFPICKYICFFLGGLWLRNMWTAPKLDKGRTNASVLFKIFDQIR